MHKPTGGGAGGATRQTHAIRIDDMTLYVQSPSLLTPSKDFPPPHVSSQINLDEVTTPKSLFGGHWDGPKYQLISVASTLAIMMSIRHWPDISLDQKGCRAMALAVAENRLALYRADYMRGMKSIKPTLKFEPIKIGGVDAFYYTYPLASDDDEYLIPFSDQYFISLSIRSVDNSPFKGEWPEMAARAKAEFLNSLELVGEVPKCE
ncbi:hypothetical protein [Prosthecobacter sp.]|uniref:hypothetical protein n=1 Tax=Prosthecobacter sp. TaxID=1965333 RepID=UPI003783EABD